MISNRDKVFSVGELSEILKACFSNPAFQHLAVAGEVYSIKLGKFSYLEIGDQGKEETSAPLLKCAFRTFYGDPFGLRDIKRGDVVTIRGSLSYYAHGSSLTLWGESIEISKDQLGKNYLLRKKTLEKLDKLGYLDEKRKRPIPRICKKIAIITAKDSAAYSDILKTLHERFPVSTVLYPATVQGEAAAKSMLSALKKAEKGDYDCILLGRGGGSKSDLSCFDDEKLCLAIATSPIPVITCIGHTIDTAIADMVSDRKAITPTEGASLINPSLADVENDLKDRRRRLDEAMLSRLDEKAQQLTSFEERLKDLSILRRAKEKKESLAVFHGHLKSAYLSKLSLFQSQLKEQEKRLPSTFLLLLDRKKVAVERNLAELNAHSLETIEKMGYALVFKDGRKVSSSKDLFSGDKVVVTFPDGRKGALIE